MASIDSLKASDGSGNASVATVQSTRSGGATTIVVDTVQGINTNFFATMGTPHTFQDPVTGEDITIISEATAVDFKGHVDGANLEIDAIAPGYTDDGSAVGDIVIIKPTTEWADEVADVLEVAHDDDGKLKDDAPITGGTDLSTLSNGWLNANETWTYDGWTAGTRIATITVPTDATTKYTPGMRVRFSQTTDGVKYGIIVKVEATLLTVFLPVGTDFDNETITVPHYSMVKLPFGFPASPEKWMLEVTDTTDRATASTSLASLSVTMGLPIGAWKILFTGNLEVTITTTSTRSAKVILSTDASTETNPRLTLFLTIGEPQYSSGSLIHTQMLSAEDNILLAAATTLTMMGQSSGAGGTTRMRGSSNVPTCIRAICNYL